MKCPKCQTEISSDSRFCTKCGCNLAVEMAKAAKAPEVIQTATCTKCGAVLKPGAKFCVKCGQAIAPDGNQGQEDKTMFLDDNASSNSEQTVLVNQGNVVQKNPVLQGSPIVQENPILQGSPAIQGNPVLQESPTVQGTNPTLDQSASPNSANKKLSNQKQRQPQSNKNHQKGGNAGKGLIIAVVVLFVLVVAGFASACFMVWNGTISLPTFAGRDTRDKEEEESSSTEQESETETRAEENAERAPEKVDATELFAEADAMLAEGKNQIANDAEVLNGMETIRSAMNQFADKAQEAGDTDIAANRIADAYASYVDAVTKHKDILDAQELSGAIYSQVMSEIKDAEVLAEEMSSKGYPVDTASLATMKNAFDVSYTERVIQEFDNFTNRDTWSRTESWNLMSGFDSAFDNSDLDNPLKLRYAYALSWWIQKQIETDLASGTITEKGAALKIGSMIEVMDYNPMMLNYYITYMNHAGEDCKQVSEAYDEIVQHIADTQGIQIGKDIALDHFWYFNDFGIYSIDNINGVTPENRQWIRDRMSSVEFAK